MKKLSTLLSSNIIFHILVWLVYGAYILLGIQNGYAAEKGWIFALLPTITFFLMVAALIYINAFYLIPSYLDKGKFWAYVSLLIILLLLNTIIRSKITQYWDSIVWPDQQTVTSNYYGWTLLNGVWSILVSTLMLYSLRWNTQKERLKNTELSRLETELKYLQAQINPHFLFNGLNTIFGHIDPKSEQAKNLLLQFSELMRYHIYEADVAKIRLKKEVDYLVNYISFQQARSSENITINFTQSIINPELMVSPLIFTVFIENAFKHISHFENKPNFLYISIKQEGNKIDFYCQNSSENSSSAQPGIGLVNSRRRLGLLYADKHHLKIIEGGNLFTVHLTLEE